MPLKPLLVLDRQRIGLHGAFGGVKKRNATPAELPGVFGIKAGNFDCQNGYLTFLLHPDQTVDIDLIGFRCQPAADDDDGVHTRIGRRDACRLKKYLKIKMGRQADINGVADAGSGKCDQPIEGRPGLGGKIGRPSIG